MFTEVYISISYFNIVVFYKPLTSSVTYHDKSLSSLWNKSAARCITNQISMFHMMFLGLKHEH